jgi:hypothetical protein
MTKPSKTQEIVLAKMAEGWQLGRTVSSWDGRAWLQKGGIGKGGASMPVQLRTVKALENSGLIVSDTYRYPTQTYLLNVGAAMAATQPSKKEE